jgi:hypothetical protein
MHGLCAVYQETGEAATIDPRQEFINEIEACIAEGRATLTARSIAGSHTTSSMTKIFP